MSNWFVSAETEPEAPPTVEAKPEPLVPIDMTPFDLYWAFYTNLAYTDLQKQRVWEDEYAGQCVEWTGRLENIETASFSRGFVVTMQHADSVERVPIVIHAPSTLEDTLLEWQIGHRQTYRATLKAFGERREYSDDEPITADWGC